MDAFTTTVSTKKEWNKRTKRQKYGLEKIEKLTRLFGTR